MKLLELFKGTGSVGKVASKKGWDVVSIDIENKFNPSICTDILNWDYKSYEGTFNFIWASPPCNTFSVLNYSRKDCCRNRETAEPLNENAELGTRILHRTLDIIKWFADKNPKMLWCIENPRGMMRRDSRMIPLYRETTTYASYGDIKYKPTDFWANFKMNLNPVLSSKNYTITRVCALPLRDRYAIPSKLIEAILYYPNRKKIIQPM